MAQDHGLYEVRLFLRQLGFFHEPGQESAVSDTDEEILESGGFQAADGQGQHFRICHGGFRPDHLDSRLGEFALAAGLGLFVTEHIGDVEQSLHAPIVFQPGSHHPGQRGSHFTPEHHRPVVPVHEPHAFIADAGPA